MADEVTPTTNPNPPEVPNSDGAAFSVQKEVNERLVGSGPKVRNSVIEHLVAEKLEERKKLILAGLAKQKEAQQAVRKAESTNEKQYDATGKVIGQFFTKPQTEELKKAKEALDSVTRALEAALGDKADFDKLSKVVGK